MIEFLAHLLGSEIVQYILRIRPYVRSLRFWLWGRSERIRVSLCAFVIIRRHNRYALIESMHRPGSFGPIGGIIKYYDPCLELIREINFDPQYRGGKENIDIKNDLRGYVAGYKLFALIRWFGKGECRETGPECLNREIREELSEIKSPFGPPHLTSRDLDWVRTVSEGPFRVAGRDYRWQFTMLQIFEMNDTPNTKDFLNMLEELSESSDQFAFATSDEIFAGRFQHGNKPHQPRRQMIGSHVEYLLRPYNRRPPDPPTWF